MGIEKTRYCHIGDATIPPSIIEGDFSAICNANSSSKSINENQGRSKGFSRVHEMCNITCAKEESTLIIHRSDETSNAHLVCLTCMHALNVCTVKANPGRLSNKL